VAVPHDTLELMRLLVVTAGLTLVGAFAQQPKTPSEMDKAVEEFKLQTRTLGMRGDSPREARQSAGRGPAAWHGRVFYNLRNDLLDAIPHEISQRGGTKSLLRRNQFGFNVSGPVVIPKLYNGSRTTFFSLSYEGMRERISRSFLRTIAIPPERTGDFSQTVDAAGNLLPVCDPATTRLNPKFDPSQPVSLDNLQYARELFPDNRIPASRLDAAAQKAVSLYPTPNATVGPFFQNNYFVVSPETNTAGGMIGKLDHTLSDRHRVSLGLSFSNGFAGASRYFGSVANPGASDRDYTNRRGSVEHVFTISPKTINTFTMEAVTDGSTTGRPEGLYPVYGLGAYLGVGAANPVTNNKRNTFIWTDSFSRRQGKHTWRIIGQYVRYQVNSFSSTLPLGAFSFGSGLTSLPGIINTGHPFGSFLLGLAESASATYVMSPSYFRMNTGLVALRESYEINKRLTVSVGVDVSISTPRVEKYDRQSTVDLEATNPASGRPGALVAANRNGQGRAFQPSKARLQPSGGLTWNLPGAARTVVRAGFARSYATIPIYSSQWGTQGFNTAASYLSENTQLDPALTLREGLPPPPPLPELRPGAVNDQVAHLMDRTDRLPTYQSASLSLERELPENIIVNAGVAYSGGKNMLVGGSAANPNAIPLGALQYRDSLNDEAFNRTLRPYPQYRGFDLSGLWPMARYQRDAAHVRLEKRTSKGLTVGAYYEFSKQMDDYSGPYGKQDFFNRKNEWSLTRWNSPHRLSLNYTYELPFGPERSLLNFSDWRRHLAQGWSLSGSTSFYSGEPLALRPQFNNTGGVVYALRVNVVAGVDPHVDSPGPELWFNPAAFEHPADFAIGNASRTDPSLRGPISQNHDLSVTKRFSLSPDRTLEFSGVGLNFLNHANWRDPDVVIGPESAPNINAGHIIGSHGARVIQVGIRFSF